MLLVRKVLLSLAPQVLLPSLGHLQRFPILGLVCVLVRPFLTPSLLMRRRSLQSFANRSTSRHAPSQGVDGSIGVSNVTRPTQLLHAPPQDTDLSLLRNSHFPLPTSVSSCVNVPLLKSFLSGYNSELVDFLVSGFTFGFHIGFLGSITSGRERNNTSACVSQDKVSSAIYKELLRDHTAGPFSSPPFDSFHCSPLGAVPKKDGSTRIILDLSSPVGSSVNDGIPPEFFSVRYSSFDSAVDIVRDIGSGCFMAKIDIKHAFRICPVHPSDWPLLGYKWLGRYYCDVRLPFGSRSSPFIFNTFADALCWILIHKFGLSGLVHYLDDFFVCASSFVECQRKVDVIVTAT